MSSEPTDLESMKEAFEELSTESLLTQLVEEAEEFRPEALNLMEQELLRRGVPRGEIEDRRAARVHHPGSEEEPEGGDLVAVAAFEERLFAEQARDVLAQKGIQGFVEDRRSSGTREFPTPDIEGPHVLHVPEEHAVRARLFLEAFTPAVAAAEKSHGEEE